MKKSSAIRWSAAAGAGPITRRQLVVLLCTARKAYALQSEIGLADCPFERWRRLVAQDALGYSPSWREIRQREFVPLMAYLCELGCKPWDRGGAEDDDRRRALHAIDRVVAASEDAFGGKSGADAYRYALSRRMFGGRDESELSAKELWRLALTIRKRAHSATRRTSRTVGRPF